MEHRWQHNGVSVSPSSKHGSHLKLKPSRSKFVGVRQRPSGKWVAEIKDTTKKIRMWLGTFHTAEQAARAYDEAAFLLRGSKTRTNFAIQIPTNSHLSEKIRSLLNHKKSLKEGTSTTIDSNKTETESSTIVSLSNNSSPCDSMKQVIKVFDDCVYRPDLSNCVREHEPVTLEIGQSRPISMGFDQIAARQGPQLLQDDGAVVSDSMSTELQISTPFYGANEYLENAFDHNDALWDLPTLCQLFCSS